MPSDNVENPYLTRDYSNSPLKRYKRLGSKNYRHIYPPSNVLHVSNISHDMTINDVKELFTKVARVAVEKVENLRDIKGQFFVVMKSLTEAIYGIMRLHNYILPNSNELKVSFSKGINNSNPPFKSTRDQLKTI
ncbi:hypothetical protein MXB_4066 [Myxobolus squamalis]|nr:hypothetical protein MXB_4066 [Myxobolus squamalis]